MRRRSHWGWGYEDERLDATQTRGAAGFLAERLGFGSAEIEEPLPLERVALREPRVEVPASLRAIASGDAHSRARHSLGCGYRDVVRAFRGHYGDVVDAVLEPGDERELESALEWAAGAAVAVIPYGGGTSVVGGVEPRVGSAYAGAISLDLARFDRLLEVDPTSLAARIEAGATGPHLEAQLRSHGLTLRHYPQSFELSTLGGWIATRAGGHFATLHTHIDDLVESVRAVTPVGIWESRRLPCSGAGVSPDRMLIGSEGTLGVITEAWMRVRPRPSHRASAAVRMPGFLAGAEAVRAIAQSGLHPANCRLIDAREAAITGSGDGTADLLLLGFESPHHEQDSLMRVALGICAEHGGTWERRGGRRSGGAHEDSDGASAAAAETWRDAFLRAPYLRDTFVAMGVFSETFETAITWERFPAFHAEVSARTEEAVRAACGAGTVSCRFTHVYPDGPAPYYTILAPARRGDELAQWEEIKTAASDAVIAAGGTITHHHAVGRDHRPWYDRQRPGPFAIALRGAKAAVDPAGILNPGVLIDPFGAT